MDAQLLKGAWTHFKGDLKQIEGNYETFVGKVQERYAGKNVELMKWATAWHQKPTATPPEKENAT